MFLTGKSHDLIKKNSVTQEKYPRKMRKDIKKSEYVLNFLFPESESSFQTSGE